MSDSLWWRVVCGGGDVDSLVVDLSSDLLIVLTSPLVLAAEISSLARVELAVVGIFKASSPSGLVMIWSIRAVGVSWVVGAELRPGFSEGDCVADSN
jgi:hypothetical protein